MPSSHRCVPNLPVKFRAARCSRILLDKLNRMQETQARPGDFKTSLDAFIARAEEHLDVVRPFFPVLVQFLPSHRELHAAAVPSGIEATEELDWTTEVA
jgi:hypothetical protein